MRVGSKGWLFIMRVSPVETRWYLWAPIQVVRGRGWDMCVGCGGVEVGNDWWG